MFQRLKNKVLYARRTYSLQTPVRQLTINDIYERYHSKTPLSMITAYDYITSYWAQQAGADMVLVGDSLAMCSLGYKSTTDLGFDEFRYHVKSVCRAPGNSFVVVDMPFGSFEKSLSDGVANAIKLMQASHRVQAIKVECSTKDDDYSFDFISELIRRGIPVVGHIGLTPQRVHSLGGYKVQGTKDSSEALALYNTGIRLQEMGCISIVLECMPHKLSTVLTEKLHIPTIGIGAGPSTSGQVLVQSDMLGMMPGHVPKFVQNYADLKSNAIESLSKYVQDVKNSDFPEMSKHAFKLNEGIYQDFLSKMDQS